MHDYIPAGVFPNQRQHESRGGIVIRPIQDNLLMRSRLEHLPNIPIGMAQWFWKKTRAAFFLSCVAGFVDAVGYIQLYHLFMGFMSDNSIKMGISLGLGRWEEAVLHLLPIFWFLVGVGSGSQLIAFLVRHRARSPTGLILLLEGALIAAYFLCENRLRPQVDLFNAWKGIGQFVFLLALPTVAMGLQTAALQGIGGHSVHTTFITGMLTRFAERSAAKLRNRVASGPSTSMAGDWASAALSPNNPLWLALLYMFYVAGAVVGAWGQHRWGTIVLLSPVCILLVSFILDLLSPLPTPIE